MLKPGTIEEVQEMVRAHERILPVGSLTKPRLSWIEGDPCERLCTRSLSGITAYEPSEYTFTALSGTPMREIAGTLAGQGQYLPCSAALCEAGATLGGTIASGLSGPGCFRFGGLRDFLLGIRYVAGDGRVISGGGKVVKNAAGFDLPKFMIGSLGRYGVLVEATFKVFPRPPARRTLEVRCPSPAEAVEGFALAGHARWEVEALDYRPASEALWLRLAGPEEALEPLVEEVSAQWPGAVRSLDAGEAGACWGAIREFSWLPPEDILVKVPLTPARIPALEDALDAVGGARSHYSDGGNVAYLALPDTGALTELSEALVLAGLRGLTLRGPESAPLWMGTPLAEAGTLEAAIKRALDPLTKFPTLV